MLRAGLSHAMQYILRISITFHEQLKKGLINGFDHALDDEVPPLIRTSMSTEGLSHQKTFILWNLSFFLFHDRVFGRGSAL